MLREKISYKVVPELKGKVQVYLKYYIKEKMTEYIQAKRGKKKENYIFNKGRQGEMPFFPEKLV